MKRVKTLEAQATSTVRNAPTKLVASAVVAAMDPT